MAEPEDNNFKPPNPLTLGEFGTLREGLLASANKSARPLSGIGLDFAITPQDVVFGSLPYMGSVFNIANLVNQARVNQLARGQVGQEPISTLQALTSGDLSATQELQKRITDEYGVVNRDSVQAYFAKNNPELDLAPLATRTRSLGAIPDNTAYTVDQGQYRVTQPFKSASFAQTYQEMKDAGRLDEIPQEVIDANLKSPDQFAEDRVYQSNIKGSVNPRTGEPAFDENFARSVTLQSQRVTPGQDDAPPSGETYICTTMYNAGLLPRKIYICDVRYGKSLNFYTYKGYKLWGKWLAKKMQKHKIIFKIFYPLFSRWAKQMAFEVSGGKLGKNNFIIKVIKRVGEAISYAVGWISERRPKWNTQSK